MNFLLVLAFAVSAAVLAFVCGTCSLYSGSLVIWDKKYEKERG